MKDFIEQCSIHTSFHDLVILSIVPTVYHLCHQTVATENKRSVKSCQTPCDSFHNALTDSTNTTALILCSGIKGTKRNAQSPDSFSGNLEISIKVGRATGGFLYLYTYTHCTIRSSYLAPFPLPRLNLLTLVSPLPASIHTYHEPV